MAKTRKSSEQLSQQVSNAINRCSRECESNTPDFILAEFMVDCLKAFERLHEARTRWHCGPNMHTIPDTLPTPEVTSERVPDFCYDYPVRCPLYVIAAYASSEPEKIDTECARTLCACYNRSEERCGLICFPS